MLKVIVVDDEHSIRYGFEKYDWQRLGCCFCGAAVDGVDALSLMECEQADIVITDIRMPEMDGIELSRQLIERYPWLKIVILTGYDDFIYAQSALNIGVRHYLLKPTNFIEFDQLMRSIAAEIETDRMMILEHDRTRKLLLEAMPLAMDKLTRTLLTGTFRSVEQVEAWLELFQIALQKFVVFSTSFPPGSILRDADSERMGLLIEVEIASTCARVAREAGQPLMITSGEGTVTGILQYESTRPDESCQEAAQALCQTAKAAVEMSLKSSVSFGLSKVLQGAGEAKRGFHQSLSALNQRFFFGEDLIVPYHSSFGGEGAGFGAFGYQREEILQAVRISDAEEIHRLMTALNKSLRERDAEYSAESVRFALADLGFKALAMLSDVDQAACTELMRGCRPLDPFGEEQTLMQYFQATESLLLLIAEKIRETLREKSHYLIGEVLRYIQLHAFSESLSLGQVADKFYLSAPYISRLIKRETGTSFMELITQRRMECARSRLLESNVRVGDIAREVGYHDLSYFIQVFKRHYGQTPHAFRENRLNN